LGRGGRAASAQQVGDAPRVPSAAGFGHMIPIQTRHAQTCHARMPRRRVPGYQVAGEASAQALCLTTTDQVRPSQSPPLPSPP
jgi:hypothetical protein